MNICEICGREKKQQHNRFCIYKKEDLDKIRQLYDHDLSPKDIINKGFSEQTVCFALRGRRRSLSDAIKVVYKNHPESFKLSQKTKDKIAKSQHEYYLEHPDKLPYLQRHSSNRSPLEDVFEKALLQNNITGWVRKYRIGLYEYDFAFPLQKIDIEIDDHTHNIDSIIVKDRKRDKWSTSNGWTVIRFNARYVKNDVSLCIEQLNKFLNDRTYDVQTQLQQSFLFLRKATDRKKQEKQQRILEKKKLLQQVLQQRHNQYKSCDKSLGWVNRLAELWGVSHTHVRRIVEKVEL
jgi:very-short-patch-repair endonuclease